MDKISALGLAAAFLGCIASAQSLAQPVSYQISPAHDGRVSLKHRFAPPLVQAWVRDIGASVSYPIVARGKVFITWNKVGAAGLTALDLRTGETVWRVPSDGADIAHLTFDRNQVFLLNGDGKLQAYGADAGDLLWTNQLQGQAFYETPPVAAGGQVFATGDSSGGNMYAVDELTGTLQWSVFDEIGDSSVPAIGDDGVYVTYPFQWFKFNPATGAEIWHAYNGATGGGGATPVYRNGRLYVRDPATGDFIVDSASGKISGAFASDQPPAFWGTDSKQSLMFSIFNGQLYAIDVRHGNVQWSYAADGQLSTPPLVINDVVAVGSASGELYVLDAATGENAWSTNVGASIVQSQRGPLIGLGAGGNAIVVPAGTLVAAYVTTKKGH